MRSVCLFAGTFMTASALAHASSLVTGYVTSSYLEGSRFAVELDVSNSCGSSKFVSKDNPDSVAVVQTALEEAAEISGVITINTGTCISGAAEIEGIAYGPDL